MIPKYRAWLRNPQGVWYMEYEPFLERVPPQDDTERLSINELAEKIINLMKCTPVSDRTGKQIWEGDVLQGKGLYWMCRWSETHAKWCVSTPNKYAKHPRYQVMIKSL